MEVAKTKQYALGLAVRLPDGERKGFGTISMSMSVAHAKKCNDRISAILGEGLSSVVCPSESPKTFCLGSLLQWRIFSRNDRDSCSRRRSHSCGHPPLTKKMAMPMYERYLLFVPPLRARPGYLLDVFSAEVGEGSLEVRLQTRGGFISELDAAAEHSDGNRVGRVRGKV